MDVRVLASWAVVAATLGGCGQPSAPIGNNGGTETETAAATSGSEACDVLTQADAARALGREVKKFDATSGAAGLDICQFGYEGEKLMDAGQVSVTIMPADLASMRAGLEREKATIEEVAGVGDAAIYTPDYGLYVGRGNRTAVYILGGGEMTDARERTIALAKETIGRL